MAAERGEIPNTLTFLIPRGGGQSGTLTFFGNQSLAGQHLSNSGEVKLKNYPVLTYIYEDKLAVLSAGADNGYCLLCFPNSPRGENVNSFTS